MHHKHAFYIISLKFRLIVLLFLNTIFSFIFLSLTADCHTKYFRYRYILSLQRFDSEEIFPELLIAVVLCVLFSWSRFRPMFLPSLAKLLQSQSKSIDALYQIQIAIWDSCATMGSTSLLQGDYILGEYSSSLHTLFHDTKSSMRSSNSWGGERCGGGGGSALADIFLCIGIARI